MFDPAVVLRPGQSESSSTPKYDSPAHGVPVNKGMYHPPAGDQQHQWKSDAESQSQAETGSIAPAPSPATYCCGLTKRVVVILGVLLAVVIVGVAVGVGVGVSKGSGGSPEHDPPPSPTAPMLAPTGAPTASTQVLYSAECETDTNCIDHGGRCNQGNCSSLASYGYVCDKGSDCSSGSCLGIRETDIDKSCSVDGGDFCIVNRDCGAKLCTPYGNAKYCESPWHNDVVPAFVSGKPCRADINCGGLNYNCVAGACMQGSSYFDECEVDLDCAGSAYCNEFTGNITRCSQPVGKQCAVDFQCPTLCATTGFCL